MEHSHGQHLALHTTGTSTDLVQEMHLWNLQHQHKEDIDHLATNCICGISRVRRTVWTMGNRLCVTTGKYHVTVLLVHTGHDAEHLGPGDKRWEYKTRSIVTSSTNLAHATARIDDALIAVLPTREEHDAEHLRPDDNRREHSANCTPAKPGTNVPLPRKMGTETGTVQTDAEVTIAVEIVRSQDDRGDLPLRHDEDNLVEVLQLRT